MTCLKALNWWNVFGNFSEPKDKCISCYYLSHVTEMFFLCIHTSAPEPQPIVVFSRVSRLWQNNGVLLLNWSTKAGILGSGRTKYYALYERSFSFTNRVGLSKFRSNFSSRPLTTVHSSQANWARPSVPFKLGLGNLNQNGSQFGSFSCCLIRSRWPSCQSQSWLSPWAPPLCLPFWFAGDVRESLNSWHY